MTKVGQLFVIATPIGNLDDISKRAVDVLKSVDFIAAENTRVTGVILQRFNISTPIVPYHDFSDEKAREQIVLSLIEGKSVGLVSDAGTPLISDPGFKLVKLARKEKVVVTPIPGACSVIAALCVSGLPTDRFQFDGFIPSKSSARLSYFKSILFQERTVIVFESKHRIVNSLIVLSEVLQCDRKIFIAREITKRFESHFNGTAKQCLDWLNSDCDQGKGEFVLVIGGCDDSVLTEQNNLRALEILDLLKDKVSLSDAVKIASEISGAHKNAIYEKVLDHNNS